MDCIPEDPNKSMTLALSSSDQPGGYVLPSEGTVNVLVVFSKFPDDNYDTTNTVWPRNGTTGDPQNMSSWVDPSWSSNPTTGSLTHYFNDMSMNKLKFTGRIVSVTSPHTRQWYLDNNIRRGDIQREIIEELDITWDFAQFDNWDLDSAYQHTNSPDGIVDMIIFVWRNIAKDYPSNPIDSVSIVEFDLGFSNNFGTLSGSEFTVDGGLRTIKTGFYPNNTTGDPGGSGVSIRNYLSYGKDKTFSIVVHEFAHYLLGNNEYHSGFGYWGMLSAWGVKNIVANSFERNRLGWIDVIEVDPGSGILTDLSLGDYVETGVAYRLNIDTANHEYFYIENHQKLNYWENNVTFGNVENGIYVLNQDGLKPSRNFGAADERNSKYLKCVPADGRFNWSVNQQIENPWGSGSLPVFRNDSINKDIGFHDLEYIPFSFSGLSSPDVIHFVEDASGNPVQDVRFQGDGNDAFRMNHNEHFNPWVNPNSQHADRNSTQFGFTITDESQGIVSIDIFTNLSKDTITAGSWVFKEDLVVPAGETLVISNGAELIFQDNIPNRDLKQYDQ